MEAKDTESYTVRIAAAVFGATMAATLHISQGHSGKECCGPPFNPVSESATLMELEQDLVLLTRDHNLCHFVRGK